MKKSLPRHVTDKATRERLKKLLQEMKEAGTRYYGIGQMPRKIPQGKIVVHNFVRSIQNGKPLIPGQQGFRVWSEKADTPNRVVCRCNWAPHLKEHYRVAKREGV